MIQSKTQIDKLGEELKNDAILFTDYLLLDEYRLSFASAYQYVFDTIVQETGLLPTGRPAKTFFSIRAKLQRENTRLSQMQDIAGCRLICNGIKEQEHIITQLTDLFPDSKIIDRRQKTSHGYRAVHLIPKISGKLIEIQLRTENQQLWAETSEKLADLIDPLIKYGGGESEI